MLRYISRGLGFAVHVKNDSVMVGRLGVERIGVIRSSRNDEKDTKEINIYYAYIDDGADEYFDHIIFCHHVACGADTGNSTSG